jgi:hypothetical protein
MKLPAPATPTCSTVRRFLKYSARTRNHLNETGLLWSLPLDTRGAVKSSSDPAEHMREQWPQGHRSRVSHGSVLLVAA